MPPRKNKSVGPQTSKGTKRTRNESENESNSVEPIKKKIAKQLAKSRDKIPDVKLLDFSNNSKSELGKKWSFKISSWNVNGLRAWLDKNGASFVEHENPDVFCIQETKCSVDKIPSLINQLEEYKFYWLSGDKDGYSGVGLLSKKEPISVTYGIGINEHDNEGRVITAEYDKFYLINVYVPNAGRGLVRLEYRKKWDQDFREYIKKLDTKKYVVVCGDLNVAHAEIDLANPKSNKKNAGFTQEERDGLTKLLDEGFVDSFRYLYPTKTDAYTFWTYMLNSRAKNVGWRIDYFIVSENFKTRICDSVIRSGAFGSDHCPITLFLSD